MKQILFTILAFFALTSNATIYSGTCGAHGDNVKWGFNDATGLLYIYGWGNMKWEGYPPWYQHAYYITSVTVEHGVNNIEDFAFQYCYYLKVANIPHSVATIGEYAFAKCHALKEVIIPYGVLSIQGSAFYDCRSLKYVELPGSLHTIGPSAFRYCSALPNISLPEGLVTIGSYAFEGCKKIERISIPSTVKTIGEYAFSDCDALVSVETQEGLETLNEGVFSYNDNLIYVQLPTTLKNIGDYQFYKCYKLKVLRMLRFDPIDLAANCFHYVPLDKAYLFIARRSTVSYMKKPVWRDFGQIHPIKTIVDYMFDGAIFESVEGYYGEPITPPVKRPEKPGHIFKGWDDIPHIAPPFNIQLNAAFGTTGITTSVDEAHTDETDKPVDVYTFDGRLLHRSVSQEDIMQTLRPGIYIINGKKIAIR